MTSPRPVTALAAAIRQALALPAGWLATNAQGSVPFWVTSNVTPDTVPNDAFVDDPATISDKTLDTPPIAITSGAAQVTFRNYYDLEGDNVKGIGFDGGVLEISINGGAFNDISTAGGSFVTGDYLAEAITPPSRPRSRVRLRVVRHGAVTQAATLPR